MAMLDGPPPSPALTGGNGTGVSSVPQQGFGGLAGPGGGMGGPTNGLSTDVMQATVAQGQAIDAAITALAQAWPAGAPEFDQAKSLVQAGLAKVLQAGAAAVSPTNVGTSFPGGGFTHGLP